jgi:hypothetical protein
LNFVVSDKYVLHPFSDTQSELHPDFAGIEWRRLHTNWRKLGLIRLLNYLYYAGIWNKTFQGKFNRYKSNRDISIYSRLSTTPYCSSRKTITDYAFATERMKRYISVNLGFFREVWVKMIHEKGKSFYWRIKVL